MFALAVVDCVHDALIRSVAVIFLVERVALVVDHIAGPLVECPVCVAKEIGLQDLGYTLALHGAGIDLRRGPLTSPSRSTQAVFGAGRGRRRPGRSIGQGQEHRQPLQRDH